MPKMGTEKTLGTGLYDIKLMTYNLLFDTNISNICDLMIFSITLIKTVLIIRTFILGFKK